MVWRHSQLGGECGAGLVVVTFVCEEKKRVEVRWLDGQNFNSGCSRLSLV